MRVALRYLGEAGSQGGRVARGWSMQALNSRARPNLVASGPAASQLNPILYVFSLSPVFNTSHTLHAISH